MVQIEHFTAPQKCLILNFQDVQIGRVGTKYLAPPSEARKLFILEMNYPSRRIIRLRRITRSSINSVLKTNYGAKLV